MGGEEVIELSVEETNELRAKLGLPPLRGGGESNPPPSSEEVLELSVDGTNALREKLGLEPLRVADGTDETGKSSRQAVHKPAANEGEAKELKARMEKARLEREVQRGISNKFASGSLADDDTKDGSDALSWAAKMRAQKEKTAASAKTKKEKKKGRTGKKKDKYDESDLQGMNVAHNVADLSAGSTTIMTLADAPLLKTSDETNSKVVGLNDEEEQTLENAELASQQKQRDGLRKKRQLELGMGRAGGYAGFDDDEFEELSGSMGPSRVARGDGSRGPADNKGKSYGFQIGDVFDEEKKERGTDLFASQEGRGISLEPTEADVTASDFMTAEEDEALLEKAGKKRKKDAKFKKKKKKEKKNRRKKDAEDDQDEAISSKGFLDELEATAVQTERPSKSKRKRRRSDSEADDATEESKMNSSVGDAPMGEEETAKKRARFDATMAKGNERTAEAFKSAPSAPITEVDDEPDDAFLSAALAKARRLRRLKEMAAPKTNRGADAVAQALQESREQSKPEESFKGGVTFAIDDTREFTRALQARAEQTERQQARKAQAMAKKVVSTTSAAKKPEAQVETVDESMAAREDEDNIEELAKEIQEDDAAVLEGTTANTVSVGRGMSNVISLLRQTGEISGKNAGKEELRGRSKDERNYENYESLDLSQVVKIDERSATEKDKEFAKREVKLEYRDAHGRLLTTKEAWRNLCYDFHGHGSSLKNEERKLRQIAREQAEARLASRQVADDTGAPSGSLGALKATQRATGKAFVIHKT